MVAPVLRAVALCIAVVGVLSIAGCGSPRLPTTTFTDPMIVGLIEAASKGDRAEVDRIHADGVDLDVRGKYGMTPLLWVAAAGNDTGVVTLIAAGADRALADSRGRTALHLAAARSTASTLQILLDHGFDASTPNVVDGSTAIIDAIMNGEPGNVTFLIQHGTDVKRADRFGNTALHAAAKINKADLLLELLAAGADPRAVNEQGVTFQRYLYMTPAKVRSATFQRGIERVQEELRRRGVVVESA